MGYLLTRFITEPEIIKEKKTNDHYYLFTKV
jgi:hypothetical protein